MKLKSYFVLYSGQVLQNHNENSNKNIVIPFFSFMKKKTPQGFLKSSIIW